MAAAAVREKTYLIIIIFYIFWIYFLVFSTLSANSKKHRESHIIWHTLRRKIGYMSWGVVEEGKRKFVANNFYFFFLFFAVGKTKHTQWYLIFNKFSSHLVGLVCGLSPFSKSAKRDPNKTLETIHMRKEWWWRRFLMSTFTMCLNDSLFIARGIESIYSFAQVL
jgi:hypothetical protein